MSLRANHYHTDRKPIGSVNNLDKGITRPVFPTRTIIKKRYNEARVEEQKRRKEEGESKKNTQQVRKDETMILERLARSFCFRKDDGRCK